MKIEAVIVCVNYSDFLEQTLPDNIQQLDDIVVVTTPEDKKTQALCAKYSVECVKTTAFTEHGDDFNKGRGINLGLSHLRKKDWLLHLDADILLPDDFRRLLTKARINPKNIYGADRVNVYGWDAWEKLKPRIGNTYSSRWFVDPGFCHHDEPAHGTRFGARVVHMEHGWVPIGYFQLWHAAAGNNYNYKVGSAAGADVIFPAQWPRENRVLLPEVVVYHLDSEEKHGIGTNWKGRKSRHFGPKPVDHKHPDFKPCGCHIHVHCHCDCHPKPYCKD